MNGDGNNNGGGGQNNRLLTALIIILVISLVLFFAQLFYVFWRRRMFRLSSFAAAGGSHGDEGSRYSPSVSNLSTASSSKELLYFMSFRSPDFGLDVNSATATATRYSNSTVTGLTDLNSDRQSDFEAIDIDLLKFYRKSGRLAKSLSTIKENQEKHAAEVPVEIFLGPSEIEAKMEPEVADQNGTGSVPENLAAVEAEAALKKEMEEVVVTEDVAPFSTPCGSPLYQTPTASPVHEKSGFRSTTYFTLTST